jgi:hypothetical protein
VPERSVGDDGARLLQHLLLVQWVGDRAAGAKEVVVDTGTRRACCWLGGARRGGGRVAVATTKHRPSQHCPGRNTMGLTTTLSNG